MKHATPKLYVIQQLQLLSLIIVSMSEKFYSFHFRKQYFILYKMSYYKQNIKLIPNIIIFL